MQEIHSHSHPHRDARQLKTTNGCTFILLFEKKICCKALTVMYFKTNYKWFSDCLLFGCSLYLVWPPLAEVIRSRLEGTLAHVSEVWGQVPVWVVLLTGYCSLQQAGGPKAKAKFRSIREHTVTSLPLDGSYSGLQNYLEFKTYNIQIIDDKNIFTHAKCP